MNNVQFGQVFNSKFFLCTAVEPTPHSILEKDLNEQQENESSCVSSVEATRPIIPEDEEDRNEQQLESADVSPVESTPQSTAAQNPNEQQNNAEVLSAIVAVHLPVRRVSLPAILPLPRVPQSGPRKRKSNRLGRTRILTNDDEFQILQEDEARKLAKQKKKSEAAERRANKSQVPTPHRGRPPLQISTTVGEVQVRVTTPAPKRPRGRPPLKVSPLLLMLKYKRKTR